MALTILSDWENNLLERREIKFRMTGNGTPSRKQVLEALQSTSNTGASRIVLLEIRSMTGESGVEGSAYVLTSGIASSFVPRHLANRALPRGQRRQRSSGTKKAPQEKRPASAG